MHCLCTSKYALSRCTLETISSLRARARDSIVIALHSSDATNDAQMSNWGVSKHVPYAVWGQGVAGAGFRWIPERSREGGRENSVTLRNEDRESDRRNSEDLGQTPNL